ncbi:NnrS family protein [Pseudochelatococcus sp. B33]
MTGRAGPKDAPQEPARRSPVPRGLATAGPVIFSYGFRPFFLGAGVWAVASMLLWIGALRWGWEPGGSYGAVFWHAHEMLFGFAVAVLAGFLLTAVPNWTGRLPVSGWPLVWLFGLWVAGRAAMLAPDIVGLVPAALADTLFLAALTAVCAREIVAGRKWRDLKILAPLLALLVANGLFHAAVVAGDYTGPASRLAIGGYMVLIMIIGGRILPSFTRNWLNRAGQTVFPVPYNNFDVAAILAGVAALAFWVVVPDHPGTAVPAAAAAALHAVRLARWRGLATFPEKLLFVLHVSYAFVPLGFAGIAAGALGVLGAVSVLHILTVGALGCMMLAMMPRVSRGHTGRALTASRTTVLSYAALVAAALVRTGADLSPDLHGLSIALAGLLWIAAFGLFCLEYAPMLWRVRRTPLAVD